MGELSANSVPAIFSVGNSVGARIGEGLKSVLSSGRAPLLSGEGMLQQSRGWERARAAGGRRIGSL